MDALELVLPSGKFARLRPILWGDVVAALAGPSNMAAVELMVRCVTIDGEKLTKESVMELPFEDVIPINTVISEVFAKIAPGKKGIA